MLKLVGRWLVNICLPLLYFITVQCVWKMAVQKMSQKVFAKLHQTIRGLMGSLIRDFPRPTLFTIMETEE